VPRPVNLAARCRSPPSVGPAPDPGSSPLRQPLTGTWHPHRRPVHSMDAALMSFQHAAIWLKLIIGSAPAPALDSHVVPVRSQSTPVTAEPPPAAPARPAHTAWLRWFMQLQRHGCGNHAVSPDTDVATAAEAPPALPARPHRHAGAPRRRTLQAQPHLQATSVQR